MENTLDIAPYFPLQLQRPSEDVMKSDGED